ncbi:MAG: HAD family hydrolase [Ruminococcaceae bacterium]|nr:HAD family hydrolase [Oscillospiraceae bacterium]
MKYSGVIFDFDGTLADSAEDVWLALEYAFEKKGVSIGEAYRNNPVNLSKSIKSIVSENGGDLSEEEIESVKDDIDFHYGQFTNYPNTSLYPGMLELLEELAKREIKTGIVSNKGQRSLERILEIKGLTKYFPYVCGGDFLGKGYGKDDILAHLLDDGFKDLNVIYIGDSYSDIVAAHFNNIDSIGVLYGDGDNDDLIREKPTYICNDPWEINKMFFSSNIE